MTGRAGGQSRPGPGGRTKSGKPRAGTGGYGKRKLEGKGPTPPAEMRPGHPKQRRAAAQARAAARGDSPRGGRGGESRDGDRRGGRGAAGYPGRPGAGARAGATTRGAGSAAEIIAGRNAVLESLRARVPATALHVGPRLDADERIGEAVKLAADTGIPVVEAGRAELDRMTGGAIHQGLALKVAPYSYAAPGDLVAAAAAAAAQPLIVALDGVTDPRNLGAVARSVAAFGGHGVLVPVRRSAGVTAGAWKASAGALARVPVAQASNLAQALAAYQQAGLFVVGLDAGGPADIGDLELADAPLVLVIGAEGRGLSRLITQRCDAVARIPITGAESLNASVAAGIALYAVARRRG
ncbi:MAG TPA: 23S rRNA (guanosine(2251)-2'-O)-methyltransferase RlmB [Streptosporangiaceae bacterium]|nr:23S rRNA (guanosine(2251)-2'-O)-methyltransferase RlmB [Streptosporangiaceae bacterium]